MGAHTTTDDPTRYRMSSDVEQWRLRDPIERVRVYLSRQGLADRAWFDQVSAEADDLGARLRDGCRAMPDPHVLDVFDQVFAEQTEELARHKADFAAYLDTFEDPDGAVAEPAEAATGGAR
jgi:2-oxoisovalerate dehydrogenase E1 component alpha subunit